MACPGENVAGQDSVSNTPLKIVTQIHCIEGTGASLGFKPRRTVNQTNRKHSYPQENVMPGMVVYTSCQVCMVAYASYKTPVLGRMRPKYHKIEASLDYPVIISQLERKKEKKKLHVS